MHGWSWALYHRDSRCAVIALGITDYEYKARGLVELADRVAGDIGGVGVVISPCGEHYVLHRTTEDGYVWHPMFTWEPASSGAGAQAGIPGPRAAQ